MNRKILLPAMLALMAAMLAGCFCSHESWTDADCVTPKTCESCGETEGEPTGHSWLDAACEAPKTCSSCGETEGVPAGHNWLDASCETPRTCTVCQKTEGQPLGHTWLDATTEAPITCAVCAATEGERIITDPRFTTAANQSLFGIWEGRLTISADALNMGLGGIGARVEMLYRLEFHNDGSMTVTRSPADPEEFVSVMVAAEVEKVYRLFEWDGYSRKEADAAIRKTYDMTMEEYVAEQMGLVDVEELFRDKVETCVYYLEGETLFRAPDWSQKMTPNPCTVENDKLYLSLDGADSAEFTPVEP